MVRVLPVLLIIGVTLCCADGRARLGKITRFARQSFPNNHNRPVAVNPHRNSAYEQVNREARFGTNFPSQNTQQSQFISQPLPPQLQSNIFNQVLGNQPSNSNLIGFRQFPAQPGQVYPGQANRQTSVGGPVGVYQPSQVGPAAVSPQAQVGPAVVNPQAQVGPAVVNQQAQVGPAVVIPPGQSGVNPSGYPNFQVGPVPVGPVPVAPAPVQPVSGGSPYNPSGPNVPSQTSELEGKLIDNATLIRPNIVDGFSCQGRKYGYYADTNNECQIFHVCYPLRDVFKDDPAAATVADITYQFSFICNTYTRFSQDSMTCAWEHEAVSCQEAPALYDIMNQEFFKIPPKKTSPDGQNPGQGSQGVGGGYQNPGQGGQGVGGGYQNPGLGSQGVGGGYQNPNSGVQGVGSGNQNPNFGGQGVGTGNQNPNAGGQAAVSRFQNQQLNFPAFG